VLISYHVNVNTFLKHNSDDIERVSTSLTHKNIENKVTILIQCHAPN
jgi:hypothetical protein